MKNLFSNFNRLLILTCTFLVSSFAWGQEETVEVYRESFYSETTKAAAATESKVTATQSMFYDKSATVWSHYVNCSSISKNQTATHSKTYCKGNTTTSIQHTASAASTEYTILEVTDIDIQGITALKLNYTFYFSGGTNYKSYAKIDGGNYTQIATATSGSSWTYIENQSITGTGNKLSLKFTYKSNKASNIFYLDEILVTGTASVSDKYYLAGSMTDWATNKKELTGSPLSTTVELEKSDYTYKIIKNSDTWYGNGGTMDRGNCTGWEFKNSVSDNAGLTADVKGNYTFSLTVNGSGNPVVTVTYPTKYTVTYYGNNNTSGSAPNPADYASGALVTVSGNTGSLAKYGYDFSGWNTKEDGTGTNYTAGYGTFTINGNTSLYAKWTPQSTKRVYLSPCAAWTDASAKFGLYDVTNETWQSTFMTAGTGCYAGYYYSDVPVSCTKVVVGRFAPATPQPFGWSGDNFWGQSVDCANIVDGSLITITGWNDQGKGAATISTFAPPTYTVSCAPNTSGYGTVSQASVTNVACGTSISATGATLTVGATTVTATAAEQTAQYTYGFSNWTWTESLSSVTKDITATANFTRSTRTYTINALTLTGCTVTGTAWPTGTKEYGSSFSTTISASEGYQLPSSISVTGADYTWNQSTGALEITSVKGNVTVTITATKKTYTVTFYNTGTTVKTTENVEHGTLFSAIKPTIGTGSGQLNIQSCDNNSPVFMGWTSDASFQKRPNAPSFIADDTAITSDLELRAVWAKEQQ